MDFPLSTSIEESLIHPDDLHNYFSFPRPVEFAQINSLPTTEQEFAALERKGHARTDQRRFNMCVGVVLEVFKLRIVLRDQPLQKSEHVGLHVRIRVLVYRQTAGRVLTKTNANPVAFVR